MFLNETKIKRINEILKSKYPIIPTSTIERARSNLSHDCDSSHPEQLPQRKWKMTVGEVVMHLL